ncbi:MAG: hypothetical protein JNM45_12105 [Rhizobiales bacterium]|nr:hypothetical protein [Hyphomicrobiales bacterium]
MSQQVDGVIELKPEKADAKAEKPVKAAAEKAAKEKTPKEKPVKEKAPKTSFAGRVEEISLKGDGSMSVVLKDKRGKDHAFVLSGNLASTITAQLLSAALGSKLKLHVTTAADNSKQIMDLSLHAKK